MYADLPWTEIRDALAGDAPVVAILPLGAIEAHGPHLPLGTDVIISDGMAKRAAKALEAEGIRALVLPALAYAPAEYAAEFAGTISIGAATAAALLLDIARSRTNEAATNGARPTKPARAEEDGEARQDVTL